MSEAESEVLQMRNIANNRRNNLDKVIDIFIELRQSILTF